MARSLYEMWKDFEDTAVSPGMSPEGRAQAMMIFYAGACGSICELSASLIDGADHSLTAHVAAELARKYADEALTVRDRANREYGTNV